MPNRNEMRAIALIVVCIAFGAVPAIAQQARMTGMQLSGDQPIQIESDRLEVRDEDNIAIFTGNVAVTQGNTLMRSGKMTVHYGSNSAAAMAGASDIERIEVEDGVHLRSDDQVATGDRATFDMLTEILVMTGEEVVLSEGDNVIIGCQLTVEMATGRAQLQGCTDGSGTGRVRMLLQPGSQDR
jgi:lipopolysaccharide export system protein LptA